MKLRQLIQDCKPQQVVGSIDREVTGIEIDSRRICEGAAFVAMRGTQVDGHTFIGKAIELGATVVVCEKLPEETFPNVTYLVYPDTEDVVGPLATHFFGDPTRRMHLIGVTGTNGKTTIATVLYNIFRQLGYKCGLCSTVCNYIDGEPVPTEVTTPDPIALNRLLGRMADEDAKKGFFDALPADAFAIINADDRNGMVMVQNCKAMVKTYSLHSVADFKARIMEESFEGMDLEIDGREVSVQFVGRFNVSNLLAVYGATIMLGVEPQQALVLLSAQKPVNGRFEAIRSREGVTAIVDYAHTPDALVNVLTTINEVLQGRGKCWTVCGAGGNRDKGKRPLMAQEAVKHSDRVIITSDNPRNEDPQEIINDMLAGLDAGQRHGVLSIVDRREAIRTACTLAQPGDVILVAGKGHEDYQIIKGVKHHFDDHEVIREAFGIQTP